MYFFILTLLPLYCFRMSVSVAVMTTASPWVTNMSTEVPGNDTLANGTMDYACHIPDDYAAAISLKIYLFASLFFVAIGLVGNTLSIVVFSSKEMRMVSSNVYLLTLALSDSLYLIAVFLTKIITSLRCLYFEDSYADISNRNNFACVLLQYMNDLFSDYSACLILAFTVERFIACYHPIKFKEICTVKRARIVCLLILVGIAALICPHHILFFGRYPEYNVCTVLRDYESEFTILYVVEALAFRICPVFIIAVLNVFIISKVTKLHRERRKRHSASRAKSGGSKKNSGQQDKHLQLTVMLILVSSTYIILYIPVLVHFVLWKLQRSEVLVISSTLMEIIRNYTSMLFIFGFAINFFLYTMSGKVFRDQLELILCETRLRQKSVSVKDTNCTQDEKQTLV